MTNNFKGDPYELLYGKITRAAKRLDFFYSKDQLKQDFSYKEIILANEYFNNNKNFDDFVKSDSILAGGFAYGIYYLASEK